MPRVPRDDLFNGQCRLSVGFPCLRKADGPSRLTEFCLMSLWADSNIQKLKSVKSQTARHWHFGVRHWLHALPQAMAYSDPIVVPLSANPNGSASSRLSCASATVAALRADINKCIQQGGGRRLRSVPSMSHGIAMARFAAR